MPTNHIDPNNPDDFDRFFESVSGRELRDETAEGLEIAYSLFQNAADKILSELGKRGLIESYLGSPVVPMHYPEDYTPPPTVLNGGQGCL